MTSASTLTDARAIEPRRRTVFGAALGLFLCTGGPSTYLTLHVLNTADGGTGWITTYAFGFVAIGGASALAGTLRQAPWRTWPWPIFPVAGFAAWAVMSALWSVSSQTTAVNALINVGIMAFGCWFGLALSIQEHIWTVMLACSTAVVLSAMAFYAANLDALLFSWYSKNSRYAL